MPPPRPPLRTPRVATEFFVDEADASAVASADEAVARSHSVLLVEAVATHSEMQTLCDYAVMASTRKTWKPASRDHGIRPGRIRGPVHKLLNAEMQDLCDAILKHAVTRIDDIVPDVCAQFFGDGLLSQTILHNGALRFSPGEPAINIYTSGGSFEPHTDKQSLTILVPLSSARDGGDGDGGDERDGGYGGDGGDGYGGDGGTSSNGPGSCGVNVSASGALDVVPAAPLDDFEGGGTAFWSRHDASHDGRSSRVGDAAPRVVVRPPPGTAIVFGGELTHAALPVLAGRRVVLVASFSALLDVRLRARAWHCHKRCWRALAAAICPRALRSTSGNRGNNAGGLGSSWWSGLAQAVHRRCWWRLGAGRRRKPSGSIV